LAAGPLVARAEVAVGVIGRELGRRALLHLAQPGPLRALGRNEDPFAGQRVVAPVGMLEEQCLGLIGHACGSLSLSIDTTNDAAIVVPEARVVKRTRASLTCRQ